MKKKTFKSLYLRFERFEQILKWYPKRRGTITFIFRFQNNQHYHYFYKMY